MKSYSLKNSSRFLLIAGLLIAAGCSKTIYPSAWQAIPVTADGNLEDWTLPLPYYDDDTKLNYNITNDTRNLYICARTSDVQAQMKMLRAGFTVWLDVKGKKNELTGIRYPLPQSLLPDHRQSSKGYEHKENGNGENGGTGRNKYKAEQQMIAAQKQMDLIGFKKTDNGGNPNGLTFLRTNEGIAVAISIDSTGELVYEAVIPFKTFFKETVTASDTDNPISIAMVENGISIQSGEHRDGGEGGEHMRDGEGGGMGGGMRGGGMRGGGMRAVGGGDRSDASEIKKVWTYIRLGAK